MVGLAVRADTVTNPIDIIEAIADGRDLMVERATDDEANLVVDTPWCDLHVSFNWHANMDGLHMAATLDTKVPTRRAKEVARAVALINEQLLFGHFDLWQHEGLLLFRHTHILGEDDRVSAGQCERMLAIAVETAERYYPVFQFVIWAGKSAEEAMAGAQINHQGEA